MHVVLDSRVVTGSGGGPDKTILNSPRFLSAAGYRMLCAYMHPPGDPGFEQLRQKAVTAQAPLVSVADRGPWDWRVVWQFLRLCRRERVEIWHGHDYKSNALGLLLRRLWPMRLVTTVHGWVHHTKRTPLYYKIDELCLPHYEAVICVSQDLHERCLASGVPAQRCQLIENAIDTQEYARHLETGEAKRRLGLPPERALIGAVGRLSAEKGFDVLIRATDQLLHSGAEVALVIVGAGEQEEPLRALISQLGRHDRIRLLGYRARCPVALRGDGRFRALQLTGRAAQCTAGSDGDGGSGRGLSDRRHPASHPGWAKRPARRTIVRPELGRGLGPTPGRFVAADTVTARGTQNHRRPLQLFWPDAKNPSALRQTLERVSGEW